nr:PAS domain-containing protein [Flavobacteriales bacterium]
GRFMHIATERKEESTFIKKKTVMKQEATHTDFRKSAEAIMVSKSPASVIVNVQMDIVHVHGDITPFLLAPQGKPSHNLMKMAREGLAFELRNAIHKAKKSEETVIKKNISVHTNGKQSMVTIEITPLTNTVDLHYLIQFEKKIIPAVVEENKSSSGKINTIQKQKEQLEKELSHTREDMRSVTEDMEAANEELQSANEELQSSNEEMQSLNEELETSREEIQSTNEELIIVNQELLDKQSELNASRHYAESIVTTIRHPLIILDKTLRIKTANASFYKVFNAEVDDTEGQLFYEIQNHQWNDNEMQSLLEKIYTKEERLTDFEILLKLTGLGERIMLLNAREIVNEHTSEKLILLAIEDVTERKAAEEKLITFAEELEDKVKERTAELKVSIEELKQSNMHLDQFAHIASHDLQEPLRKILTFSMRLQDKHKEGLSTQVKSYLNKIEGASGRMQTLIKDLLNYSRLLQLERLFAPTDLNEILKSILNDFELLIQEKKAEIKMDSLPSIEAIPLQMNQLFYNLISNALKYSREDVPPVITITSQILTEEQKQDYPALNPFIAYVKIIFKDNGIGFEQQYADKIFTIFQRLHDKETYIGTGIGLALSKKIIENHHGEIFADATLNEGAEFQVILPIKQAV